MRILLVEDDAGIVSNLTEFLHGEGFAVEAAAGQTEAQEKLEQGTYDLILLDVSLVLQSVPMSAKIPISP